MEVNLEVTHHMDSTVVNFGEYWQPEFCTLIRGNPHTQQWAKRLRLPKNIILIFQP